MVTVLDVQDALHGRFGSALTDDPSFSGGIARILQSFTPWRDDFAALARRMEDYLFNALYDRLGPSMTLRLDDGSFRRIRMDDLPSAADEALYPLFASLKPYSVHYEQLHAYWMETGSVSAMRALYLHFSDFLPEQERKMIERIADENMPVSLRNAWFFRKDDTI